MSLKQWFSAEGGGVWYHNSFTLLSSRHHNLFYWDKDKRSLSHWFAEVATPTFQLFTLGKDLTLFFSLSLNRVFSSESASPDNLKLAYAIVEIQVGSLRLEEQHLSTSEKTSLMSSIFLTALYQAGGLEGDGECFQVHLPIQP